LVGSHPSYKTAVEFSINNSDTVTSVSKSLKEDTLRLFSITNEIKVIHNFIDTEKYDRELQNDCQRIAVAKPNERILTHISNFRPVKRIKDVIKVFYKVQQELPSKLLMVGEGPEKRNAELQVKKLGIEDKVIFLGNSHEISKILCYTDVFLLPSESESFGLAALEAMAASTAVISTNTGGLPEVNIHGETGYLSNLGDCDNMAINAISILKDDDILINFKKAAQEHTKQFCLDNILPIYENVYNAALNKVH
jgi:N-acetyl-alpha-D-glucosaminyl L-malate synthase BshA